MRIISGSLSGAFPKDNVVIDGENCIFKYPLREENIVYPLHLTEYISCKLIEQMGYPVQSTSLINIYDKEAVKIKIFKKSICPVLSMGEYTLETYNIPHKSLNSNTIEVFKSALQSESNAEDKIFEITVIDSLTLNTDRHLGNIAIYKDGLLAPLYDNGLSLGVVEYFSKNITDPSEVLEKYKMQFRYKTKRMTWEVFEKRYNYLILQVAENTINNLKIAIENTNIEDIVNTIPIEMQCKWSDYLNWVKILYAMNKKVVLNRLNDLNTNGGSLKWI